MALKNSVDSLNDKGVFGFLSEGDLTLDDEINEVWGEQVCLLCVLIFHIVLTYFMITLQINKNRR